ncbi:unnamed protein product [Didymodactylos carnosus]|uniref:Uncharacterized protein n=1 Tax=Didymodactylos carnosus TaxID=1234261 RepID=A0A8S2FGX4_9BILA|nr:unnamed protein product [Didymodactylos carnosus]CAF4256256.1 unnamed protein product [Didymodactylos carnosus]
MIMIKQPSVRKAAFNIDYLISSHNDNDKSTISNSDNDLISTEIQPITSSYHSTSFIHPLANILRSINPYVGILTNSYNSSIGNCASIETTNNGIIHHKTKYQKHLQKYSHNPQHHKKFERSMSTDEQKLNIINRSHESGKRAY